MLQITPGLAQSLALLCFSLPCRALRFATPGLATLRVPFPFPLAAGALAKQMAASCGKESRGLGRPLFCLVATPYESLLSTVWLLNKISIAFAMLTPCEFMCFAEREALEPIHSRNIIKLQITDNHTQFGIHSKSKSF